MSVPIYASPTMGASRPQGQGPHTLQELGADQQAPATENRPGQPASKNESCEPWGQERVAGSPSITSADQFPLTPPLIGGRRFPGPPPCNAPCWTHL